MGRRSLEIDGTALEEDYTWYFITETPLYSDTGSSVGSPSRRRLSLRADGRVFVAEKSGIIKVFDDLNDPSPDLFADLRTNVHNHWDRGLLGMALHPDFPTTPELYVLYTYDAPASRFEFAAGLPGSSPGPTGVHRASTGIPGQPAATVHRSVRDYLG